MPYDRGDPMRDVLASRNGAIISDPVLSKLRYEQMSVRADSRACRNDNAYLRRDVP